MRILSLDLDRYGPFTGRRLSFRPDAALHVVLGPNEAGKSSALAAVTDLLFGTRDTRYEFLHREAGLRLGAEILARDGRTFTFYRRRGIRSTLSDAQARPLPDDALAPFLGGLTRSVFCNAFGMDAAVLRQGADEMLKSDGEVGKTLFAAASGLRGFRDAADTLESEAAALFTPTARKRRLNDLIRTYDEARAAAARERVGRDGWRAIEKGLAEATERLDEIAVRRKAIAEEASGLRRLKAVAPILAILDGLAGDLERFADLPDLDAGGVAEVARAAQILGTATERAAAAEAALARAEADRAAIPVDAGFLAWAEAVETLNRESGAYRRAAADEPRIRADADRLERDLAAVAVRLGLADAGAVETRQPTDAARADLKRLLASGRDIEAERLRLGRERERLRGELDALRGTQGERAPLVDPGPLRVAHEALRPVLAEIGRRDALRAEVAHGTADLDRAVARLRPAPGPVAAWSALPLPSGEAIARHGAAIADAARDRDGLREQLAGLRTEIAAVTGRMAARQAAEEVPDRAALARTRQARDAAWAQVRAAAFNPADAPRGADLLERAVAFEQANAAADALADRLVADAQRAADQAADARRLDGLNGDGERISAALAEAEAGLAAAQDAWRSLWAPLSIAPASPVEMAEWRNRAAAIHREADALAARRIDAEALAERIEAVRPQVERLAERLGLAILRGADLALLAARVTERLQAVAETWDAARDNAARIASMEASVRAGEAALAALAERETAWRPLWDAALSACALPPGASLDGAGAGLDAWAAVPALVGERDDRRRRVAGMRRDMETHETELRRIARAVGHAADRPAAEILRALTDRAEKARAAAIRHGAQVTVRDEAARAREEAEAALRRARAALAEIEARCALPDTADLDAFVARLESRAHLEDAVTSRRAELARASEGVPEAELRAGLAQAHVDVIEGRLSDLGSEDERLDHDGRVAYADRDRLQAERARIEGGIGAEAATARKGAAEIEIRETARRYVVLKLGSLLLGAAIDRHRAGQQDPLVRRAAALFSDLTGGAYEGLDQTFDDRDQPILAGRRAGGRQPVAVGNMSEGTRDQLFLALRLAYLEDYAGRAEPAPFLGDDIFASFDDARTAHGLAALAAIGQSVQPILFTHHASVAQAAERCLGDRVDVVALG